MITNRERINGLSNEEFLVEIRKIIEYPGFEFADWESWFNSDEEFPKYIGKPGIYRENCSDVSNWGGQIEPGFFQDTDPIDCLILQPFYLDHEQRAYHIFAEGKVFPVNAVHVKYVNKEDEEQAVWPERPPKPVVPKPSGPDDLENIW